MDPLKTQQARRESEVTSPEERFQQTTVNVDPVARKPSRATALRPENALSEGELGQQN
jgi:hypothetical protein